MEYRRHFMFQVEENGERKKKYGTKGHEKGHKNVPFWVLDGFKGIALTLLKRMAGTTRLELATSAVTGTASHWKYVVDNVNVYRGVYRADFCQQRRIGALLPGGPLSGSNRRMCEHPRGSLPVCMQTRHYG
jgi:hypothetical protein